MMIVATGTGLIHKCFTNEDRQTAKGSPQDYLNKLRQKIVWCLQDEAGDPVGVCLHFPEYGMKFRLGPRDNVVSTSERATFRERLAAYAAERKNEATKPTVYR